MHDRAVTSSDWAARDTALTAALHPTAAPVAITFGAGPPAGVAGHGGPIPAPLPDGRTGRVPAGCVFWMHATDRTFTTTRADHGNCSVASLTHGFASLDEVAGNDDVAAMLGSGWVSMEDVPAIPVVLERPGAHGMPSTEITCAIPATELAEVVAAAGATAAVDAQVAAYAAEDWLRFGAAAGS